MEKKEKPDIKVRCPKCEKEFSYWNSKFRPFCNERCKMVDLEKWLNEGYAVPVSQQQKENDSEDELVSAESLSDEDHEHSEE
jgi:endogenous inhibitor of DNA gyrase (YacG/DUF329 family)